MDSSIQGRFCKLESCLQIHVSCKALHKGVCCFGLDYLDFFLYVCRLSCMALQQMGRVSKRSIPLIEDGEEPTLWSCITSCLPGNS